MKRIFFILTPFFILLTAGSYSQVQQEWIQKYDGKVNNDDEGRFILLDGSGNVYVTGWSWGNGTGYDYATIKYKVRRPPLFLLS